MGGREGRGGKRTSRIVYIYTDEEASISVYNAPQEKHTRCIFVSSAADLQYMTCALCTVHPLIIGFLPIDRITVSSMIFFYMSFTNSTDLKTPCLYGKYTYCVNV